MHREFLLNILFLVFVNLLIKPFFIFGIDRTIQNQVGLEDYGIYVALYNFTFLLSIINDFGIQSFNNQHISQNNQLLDTYFPNILLLKVALGILFTLLVFSTAVVIGYDTTYFYLIGFLLLNHILHSATLFFRSNISALGFYRTDSLMTVLERTVLIGICSILLWANPFNTSFQIEWFIYAQTCSLFIAASVAFALVYRQLSTFKLSFDKVLLWDLLKKSLPFALIVFLMSIYTRIDFVMIERLLVDGKKEAGIYASAYRLLDAANVIGVLFSGLLLPMFAKLLKEKADFIPLLQISGRMMFCGTLTLAIAVACFRVEIMTLLYDQATLYSASILGVLIFTFILVGGGYIYGTLLLANHSLKQLNYLFLWTVALNIGLNFFVIPRWGALGAACTTLITQSFALIGQVWIAKKVFQLATDVALLKQLLRFILLFLLINYIASTYFPFYWGINFSIVLLLGVVLGFATNLLNPFWLMELVKSKN